jgi:hypothetical protein
MTRSSFNPKALEFWEKRYLNDPQLGSGVGSKDKWKRRKLDAVRELVKRHRVKSILDIGCGDMQVMRDFPDLLDYKYVGIDFSETVIEKNRQAFPGLEFRTADFHHIADLGLEPPDLVLCFDVLFHIQNDETFDRVCQFIFNCGAKAAALTCAVGRQDSNDVNVWYRDFWREADRLQLGYVQKLEQPFRLPCERLMTFDLCDPAMDGIPTEVVYVCSPDREAQLVVSLGTLLRSGRGFDRIVVFGVGIQPSQWRFDDSRIIVKSVPPLFGKYFYGNKLHLCSRRAARVVFLDTDTMVQRPLHLLWDGRQEDFLARVGTAYEGSLWNKDVWNRTADAVGAPLVPMFNAGVLVFQNGAHRKIQQDWSAYIQKYLDGDLTPPYDDPRMPEQWGLALAIGHQNIQYSKLSRAEHAFGWVGEDYEATVVFHTGTEKYERYRHEMGFDAEPIPLRGGGNGHVAVVLKEKIARYLRSLQLTGQTSPRSG